MTDVILSLVACLVLNPVACVILSLSKDGKRVRVRFPDLCKFHFETPDYAAVC